MKSAFTLIHQTNNKMKTAQKTSSELIQSKINQIELQIETELKNNNIPMVLKLQNSLVPLIEKYMEVNNINGMPKCRKNFGTIS